ncbi:hypothetical protein PBI_DEWDROP_74 [Microbacterium phage Dewdrop]|nr:hypothetical protein PBI_LEAF_74 [Microbacterium phage Leaf]QGZ17442.1 hypothetical protein PBI_DEWDROP_74 [Microbacterium phage Dewdrop]
MAELIEIEADEPELIPVKLVGVQYMLNPPKASLTMNMADSFTGKEMAKPGPNASKAELEAARKEARKTAKKTRDALRVWTIQAFGKETAAAIDKRLLDPEDRLDIPHLMDLMNKVAEAGSGNPTT